MVPYCLTAASFAQVGLAGILRVLDADRAVDEVAGTRGASRRQERVRPRDLVRVDLRRLPVERAGDPVRLDRRPRREDDHEDRRAGRPQPAICDRGSVDVTSNGCSETMLVFDLPEPDLEAVDQVLAVVVVLVDDADLRVGVVLADVTPVDQPLADVVREPGGRPRELLPVAGERLRARGREHLRHARGVQVRPDGEIDLGAERADDGEDLVLLDQPPRELDAVRRVVDVVVVDPVDLTAEDATLPVGPLRRVDVAEVGLHRGRDRPVERRSPGQREAAADLDRSGGDARRRGGTDRRVGLRERTRDAQRESAEQREPEQ